MSERKHLIVVGGPTASGKTELAIRLARHFQTEIISCDSRQFFRELRIGTAVPSPAELAQAPHHFIGHLSIQDTYNVGDFEREALQLLGRLFQEQEVVVLTGGSGLYLKALCEGLDEFPAVEPAVRKEVEDLYREEGLPALQAELAAVDPDYFAEVDRQNPHRLIRAIAVFRASGRPFSSFRSGAPAPRPFVPVYMQTHWPRATLYERINRRVDLMMEAGLLDEARQLYPYRDLTPLQTVGYQELFAHFEGKSPLSEAVELIKRNTRRYAKRQLTWLRRDGYWKHIGSKDWELALAYIDLARRQGLLIRGSSPSSGTQELRLAGHGEDAAGLQLTKAGRDLLLWQFETKAIPEETTAVTILLHEALCRSEEKNVFAILPRSIEPLAAGMGFESITPTTGILPPVIDKFQKAKRDGEDVCLFRRTYHP